MKSDEIEVQAVRNGSNATVAVTGQLTIDSSPQLRSVLLRLLRRRMAAEIVVEMSAVSYTDTSGVATLLEVLKMARECSVTLRLAGLNGQCRMLLEIMEVEHIFRPSGGEVDLH